MELAEKLVLLYSLFGVSMCSDVFSVTLPQSVEAVNGLCVLIRCSFTIYNQFDKYLQNNPKGIWFKDGTEEDKTVFDSTTPESNKIKGRITGDLRMKDCTTIFNRINNSDSGTYYFRIDAGRLKYTYKPPVFINVRDAPPKPTLSLYRDQTEVEDQRVLEGSSVRLLCSALSLCPTQPPTLIWSPLPTNINQQQIQNTSFISSQLNFIATRFHHGLRFNCTATYQLEDKDTKTAQRSLVLRVLYPPKNTSVSVSPSGPVILGSLVSLSCSSDGNPAVNYTWYREDGEQIGTGASLTIKTYDTHSGLYCRAQNQHGAQNSSVQLDIQYAPRNTHVSVSPSGPVILGSSLSCSSDGNPAVNYTWYRDNGEQIGTGSSLTIKTDGTHSGLYCRAQNQHGAQNSSIQLDIQYAPKNTSVSVSPSGPVMLGSSVSLYCSSDGNPAVNYTWYRQNGEQIGTGPSLTINKTDNTHSGLYCRAQNQHGAQTSSVHLDVQYAPQISFSFHCNSSSEGVVQCVCEVHGSPVSKLEWHLSGQPIPPSVNPSIKEESVGSIGLRSVLYMHYSLTDMHSLQCVSTNELGSTTKLIYSVATGHCSECKLTIVPYVILTVLLLLCAVIIGFLLYKLRQLSTKTKALKVEGDTYASLQLSAQSSDYETLQPNRVSMCRDVFSVTLPQSVEAVNGLCVLINCSFTIENQFDEDLQVNPKAIWRKDGIEEDKTVFDSKTPESNKIKGRITGDLQKKDCTTIFNNVNKNDTGTYYFRIVAGIVQDLKYVYTTASVSLHVRDSPPKPTLSLNRDQTEVEDRKVLEGSSVSLLCSALSPCPTQPPTLTWSPLPTNINQQQIQSTSFISSQLNFIATRLHHGLRFNCTATYQLENKVAKTAQRSLILRVLYPPKNTSVSVSPSGPVMLGNSVILSCSSEGNPAVNYTWYRQNGEQIGTGPSLTIKIDDTHSGLYCRAQNQHGAQTSVKLDIQYAPKKTSVSVSPSGPVMLGSSVSLSCSSDGNPAVNYTWYRQNGEQIGTGPSLTIKTDDTHSGLYCRAQNQHGAQNSSVQLDIQYAPKKTSVSVSPSGPVVLGSSVSLSCRSDGNPAVNYTWYRQNGEQIGTGPSLTIKTDDTHSGLYCRAQNQHGAQNSSVQLDIQYAPKKTSVSVSPSGPVVLGGSVSLSCSSDGNPAVNYTWYRQNGEEIGTGPSLTIRTDNTHSGLYCSAQNQHGAQNSSVQLDIQYAPKKTSVSVSPSGPVMLGSSVSLSCSSDGNPAVNYTWYRQNGEQIGTGPSLTIKTDDTHSGLYCRAQNQHGAQNSSVQLDIQYAPKNTSVSVSPSGPVVLGSSVSLSCSSDGNPAVNYTWYRQNGEQIGTGPSLTIKTDDTHSGLYCRAQNQHGAQNSSVQLDIQYAPKNTSVSVSPSGPVMLGSSVSLKCSSNGNPAVSYTWYRENGEQKGTGHSLTINKANDTHSGLYFCRAQNRHGTQTSYVQLDIQSELIY
ncbi:hypothetical protein NFI96_010326 [Prochilodus magdalenae]|nr:hypothetical protein NFI96_010326 [Prochilodus magdalenae]